MFQICPGEIDTSLLHISDSNYPSFCSKCPRKCKKNSTHICRIKRMRRCGAPPPIIFERLKLRQQIIYRRKENFSESPNHQKYWENILVSRFYEQFSRNRRNLGHFRKFAKIKAIMSFAKFVNAFVKPRNLNITQNKLYIWNLQITCFKMIYNMFVF